MIERVVEEPRATSTDELVQVAQTDATTSDAQTDLPPSEPAAPIADLEERGRFRFPPNGRHPRARGQVIETLAALARELEAQEPGQGIQEVVLTGHAEEGERNVTELAEMRAEMIKRIMLQEGIDPQIIRVAPVGLAGRTVVLSLRR